jgi:hypothetical protein
MTKKRKKRARRKKVPEQYIDTSKEGYVNGEQPKPTYYEF